MVHTRLEVCTPSDSSDSHGSNMTLMRHFKPNSKSNIILTHKRMHACGETLGSIISSLVSALNLSDVNVPKVDKRTRLRYIISSGSLAPCQIQTMHDRWVPFDVRLRVLIDSLEMMGHRTDQPKERNNWTTPGYRHLLRKQMSKANLRHVTPAQLRSTRSKLPWRVANDLLAYI